VLAFATLTGAGLLCGCRQDMHDQPKYRPLAASNFFKDRRSERPLIEGTVARGQLRADEGFYTGKRGKDTVAEFPLPVTRELLQRGQQRFNIYCSPCHGRTGDGNGVVVQRGFSHPPTYHSDRLRQAPVGHFFDVITNGYGAMHTYDYRVEPQDRWAIIAYIRALQLSRSAKLTDIPPDQRQALQEAHP
jgi:mono/diheme cytochrome c family protein